MAHYDDHRALFDPKHTTLGFTVLKDMLQRWYDTEKDKAFLENLSEKVCRAEIELMMTLGCDFNVDLLHKTTLKIIHEKKLEKIIRLPIIINICNDIMKQDPTLVLQYKASSISLAILQFYFKIAKKSPPPAKNGAGTWYEEGLSEQQWQDILHRFENKVYVVTEATAAESPMSPMYSPSQVEPDSELEEGELVEFY